MLARSFVPMFGTLALGASLLCNAAIAATGSASLTVTVTVEAGCQVSPVFSATEIAALRSTTWQNPVSMSCSLPVPYQVAVHSEFAPSGMRAQSLNLAKESDLGLVRPGALDLSAAVIQTAGAAAGTNSGTVTVTVDY